jgi:hypothetical protein
VLVLLMRGIYWVFRSDGLVRHDRYSKLYKGWLRHLKNVKDIAAANW